MKGTETKERLKAKYKAIRKDFKKRSDEGFKSSVIIEELSWKYFMANSTLEDIVYNTGRYKNK